MTYSPPSGSEKYPDEPSHAKWTRQVRKGFYGFQGLGGSVLQWKPDEDEEFSISFAYAPTLLAWYS